MHGAGLLHTIDAEDAAAFRARCTRRRHHAGDLVLREGDAGREAVVVLSGCLKVWQHGRLDREVVLAYRGPGELLGELAVVDRAVRSASATAVAPTEVLAISGVELRRWLDERPAAAFALLAVQGRRLRDADGKRHEFAAADATGRVASRLAELALHFGERRPDGTTRIGLPLSQEELAAWCACSRESANKALRQLRGLGAVRVTPRCFVVLDERVLQARAAL